MSSQMTPCLTPRQICSYQRTRPAAGIQVGLTKGSQTPLDIYVQATEVHLLQGEANTLLGSFVLI